MDGQILVFAGLGLCVTFMVYLLCVHAIPGGGGDPGTGEMHLLPEPLYSIPTDSTFITTISSTSNGRIFMAGKDGALYELIYQVTFSFLLYLVLLCLFLICWTCGLPSY